VGAGLSLRLPFGSDPPEGLRQPSTEAPAPPLEPGAHVYLGLAAQAVYAQARWRHRESLVSLRVQDRF
jgi:hypothetical protein